VSQPVQPTQPMEPRAPGGAGVGPIAAMIGVAAGVLLSAGMALAVRSWNHTAETNLTTPEKEKPKVAIADQAEVAYCTPQFKQVLERVLHSCGLAAEGEGARRGCKPADVKTFASISDDDFNALFTPLKDRGGVIMFDEGKDDLDDSAKKLLEERWYARKGARYFFVVARASKTGSVAKNNALSHRRANSVMFFLKQLDNDPEIEQKVGLLWLGNEFAQLSKEYCSWPNSRASEKCDEEPINRSAFVSWVDCRL
jgi:outer membrane protein OmpA-like peptidoglycan-associated protein